PLSGEINGLPLTELRLQYNHFAVEDLVRLKDLLPSPSYYHPQQNTGIPQAYSPDPGEQLTLRAPYDPDLVPASEYQWFRGSQALNERSVSGHTLVLENVSPQDDGNYTYKVWNSSLPGLTLTSLVQNISVEAPGWKSITVDLASHNRVEDNRSTVNKSFLNTAPNTPYNFSYELSGLGA